jgi:hydroxyacylglutathione hydrolase
VQTVQAIPAFTDNYVWMVGSSDAQAVAIIDPGEADPVLRILSDSRLKVAAILLTHHHEDHVGGVAEILREHQAPVFGPGRERIPTVDHPVAGGATVIVPELDLEFDVIDVPGHTAGHVAYLDPGRAFVGDTLFAGGCGRIFEGTPGQMHASLGLLATLPPETVVYCAHEYTTANLRFALEVEPGNETVAKRLDEARTARSEDRPTVPSVLAEELETNPFLRCGEPEIKAAAEHRVGRSLDTDADVFAVVRRWKDGWRG